MQGDQTADSINLQDRGRHRDKRETGIQTKRECLPTQGSWVRSLVRESRFPNAVVHPTIKEKPSHHSEEPACLS